MKRRKTPAALRRRGERDARVRWILEAALEIAAKDGLGAVTITRLAHDLGYTVGAFYRYFPSLDALIGELHEHTARLFYDEFFRALGPERDALAARAPNARVLALAEVVLLPTLYRRLADSHPRHFELVHQLVTRPPTWLDSKRRSALEQLVLPRVLDALGSMSRAAHARALTEGDPVVRLMTLWVGVHAALAVGPLMREHPGLFDRNALVASMVRTLVLGWGARPEDVEAADRLLEHSGSLAVAL